MAVLIQRKKCGLSAHITTADFNALLSVLIAALKRKMQESEQKQKELKRKAECYDQLMEMGRPKRQHTSTPTSSEPSPRSTPKRTSADSDSERSTPHVVRETSSPATSIVKVIAVSKSSSKLQKGQSTSSETSRPQLIEVKPLEIDESAHSDSPADSSV